MRGNRYALGMGVFSWNVIKCRLDTRLMIAGESRNHAGEWEGFAMFGIKGFNFPTSKNCGWFPLVLRSKYIHQSKHSFSLTIPFQPTPLHQRPHSLVLLEESVLHGQLYYWCHQTKGRWTPPWWESQLECEWFHWLWMKPSATGGSYSS